jgi:hypothetical protein
VQRRPRSCPPISRRGVETKVLNNLSDREFLAYFRIPGVPGLHFVPWHRGSGCLGAAAPVTGAAADEYNLNVVDCNASVTVACRSSISVSHGGGPSLARGAPRAQPEANVKDKCFSVASLLGIC